MTVAFAASAPDVGLAVVVHDQQRLERHGLALVDDLLDLDHVAGLHLVLLAAGLDHRVHGGSFRELQIS